MINMIYMALYWITLFIFIIFYLISRKFDNSRLSKEVEDKGVLVVMFLGALMFMAIKTNDPVSFLGIEIPMELQWFGSLGVTMFGLWKLYLDPLKDKVMKIDKTVESLKTDVNNIKKDIILIKQHLFDKNKF